MNRPIIPIASGLSENTRGVSSEQTRIVKHLILVLQLGHNSETCTHGCQPWRGILLSEFQFSPFQSSVPPSKLRLSFDYLLNNILPVRGWVESVKYILGHYQYLSMLPQTLGARSIGVDNGCG